jgi:hypothetical protein
MCSAVSASMRWFASFCSHRVANCFQNGSVSPSVSTVFTSPVEKNATCGMTPACGTGCGGGPNPVCGAFGACAGTTLTRLTVPVSAWRTSAAALLKCWSFLPLVRQASPMLKGIPARSGRASKSAAMNASLFLPAAFAWLILAIWCAAALICFSASGFVGASANASSGTAARSFVVTGPRAVAFGATGSRSRVGVFGAMVNRRFGTGGGTGCGLLPIRGGKRGASGGGSGTAGALLVVPDGAPVMGGTGCGRSSAGALGVVEAGGAGGWPAPSSTTAAHAARMRSAFVVFLIGAPPVSKAARWYRGARGAHNPAPAPRYTPLTSPTSTP